MATTTRLSLTSSSQLAASAAAYISADTSFMYSFDTTPTVWHTFDVAKDSFIDYSGAFGNMYVKLHPDYDNASIIITA